MQPASPAALQLAQRLRQLRLQQWPEVRLTQEKLAAAFKAEEPLAAGHSVLVGEPEFSEAPAASPTTCICKVLCDTPVCRGRPQAATA